MLQNSFTIRNTTGLHARPAAIFIRAANQYQCNIRLKKEDSEINGKSMISLLTLGAGKGSTITVITDGQDEDKAMEDLLMVLNSFDD